MQTDDGVYLEMNIYLLYLHGTKLGWTVFDIKIDKQKCVVFFSDIAVKVTTGCENSNLKRNKNQLMSRI